MEVPNVTPLRQTAEWMWSVRQTEEAFMEFRLHRELRIRELVLENGQDYYAKYSEDVLRNSLEHLVAQIPFTQCIEQLIKSVVATSVNIIEQEAWRLVESQRTTFYQTK